MELTDIEIQNRIKKRDVKAYEYIIDKYSRQVYYVAHNILHGFCGREDIEECTADVFWKAWESVDSFDPEKGRFKTWLFILAKYKALEYKRRLLKQQTVSIEELRTEPIGEGAEKLVIARDDQERLVSVINGFNGVDRELFIRRYFYDEKISDLADSLNLTRSAIDNRLLRGRKIIKEALSYE